MTIVVTGAAGLLGAHCVEYFSNGHTVVGLDRHPWWGDAARQVITGDLLEPGFLESAIAAHVPQAIIHCAALADVDKCESDPDLARRYNADMTRRLTAAAPPGCLVVYISTDGVFFGDRPFATEAWPAQPRTVYGRTKWEGEEVVRAATDNHLVVRTNFYGWSSGRKRTSGEWLYGSLARHAPITLFDDFFFTPIYVADMVRRLAALMAQPQRGLFHLCGSERVSKYAYGLSMAKIAECPIDAITRGSIESAPLTAPRPKDMSLDSSKAAAALGTAAPDVTAGLRRFLDDRGRPLSQRFR